MAVVQDYDKIRKNRPKEEFKLAGKVIDYSFIPAKVALDALTMYDELDDDPGEKEIDTIFEVVMDVIKANNNDEELTKEWLLENADFEILMMETEEMKGIIPLIVDKVNKRNSDDEGKNG